MVERPLIVCTKGARGILPYLIHIGSITPKGKVFAPCWFENGYRFCPFWSVIGYGLRRNYGCVWMCSSVQFLMSNKESLIGEFEMDFKKSFCWRSNLSTGDIISVLCKHVMLRFVTSSRSENGCGNWHFLVWNRVRIWRTGRHIPTKMYLPPPPPPPGLGELPIMHLAYPFP